MWSVNTTGYSVTLQMSTKSLDHQFFHYWHFREKNTPLCGSGTQPGSDYSPFSCSLETQACSWNTSKQIMDNCVFHMLHITTFVSHNINKRKYVTLQIFPLSLNDQYNQTWNSIIDQSHSCHSKPTCTYGACLRLTDLTMLYNTY